MTTSVQKELLGDLVTSVKTTTYPITNNDGLILVDGTSAGFTTTLPTAVGISGQRFKIKRVDQTLANAVTIATTSSQTIDGATTRKLMTQYEMFEVESDGSNWHITRHHVFSGWNTYTPTGSWVSNTTYTGRWKRVGATLFGQVKAATSGAPTNVALTVAIPTGLTINTGDLLAQQNYGAQFGTAILRDAGVSQYPGVVGYASTTTVQISPINTAGTDAKAEDSSATVPFTFGSGDEVYADFALPITNWEG